MRDDRCDNDRDDNVDRECALSDELADEVEKRQAEEQQIARSLVLNLEANRGREEKSDCEPHWPSAER